MLDIDAQTNDGDTPLHAGFQGQMGMEMLEFFMCIGANVHIRNFSGRSQLHDAVRYSKIANGAIDTLVKFGASVKAIDDEGSSILHDVFKNPLVSLEMVEKLLKLGANPDCRDHNNKPPLDLVPICSLSAQDKVSAVRLLIQYTVVKKFDDFKRKQLTKGDDILCLNFCENLPLREKYANIRDKTISEVTKSDGDFLRENYTLFNLLRKYCCCCKSVSPRNLDRAALEKVIAKISGGEYPNLRNLITSAIEESDFDELLKTCSISVRKSSIQAIAGGAVVLNFDCVSLLTQYLNKKDIVHLIIAFWQS